MIIFKACLIEKCGRFFAATLEGGVGGHSWIKKIDGRHIKAMTRVLAIKKNS
jgi:hypothetical protein